MRRPKQLWLHDLKFRLQFERGLQHQFTDLEIRQTGRKLKDERIYELTVPVKGYESRRLSIRIANGVRPFPRVFVDGPEDSPHRYADGSLCMWHPKDEPDRKWVPRDGLLTLVRYAQLHLFREGWWHESGEWVGEQAGHPAPEGKEE